MKKLVLMFFFAWFSLSAFSQKADDIIGKWLNKDKDAHIQIYKRGDKYNGKIVWLKNPVDEKGVVKKDNKNPEQSLKNQPILGLEILKEFKFSDEEWADGKIYDPKSGKTYSCVMTMQGKDKLNVRGYLGISLIGRTDVWTRVD